MSRTSIGIDFGTTKTLISLFRENQERPELLKLGREGAEQPSVISVAERELYFGDNAEDRRTLHPSGYLRELKRLLGAEEKIRLNGEDWPVEGLAADYFADLRLRLPQESKASRLVFTTPTLFSLTRRQALVRAALMAGFEEVQLLSEPVAAGLAYTREFGERLTGFRSLLVFDWGGGTLDLAVLRRSDDSSPWQIDSDLPGGDAALGGEDLDQDLVLHFLGKLKLRLRQNDDDEGICPQSARQAARKVKELLSQRPEVSWSFTDESGNRATFALDRSGLAGIVKPRITAAVNCLRELLLKADKAQLKIEAIALAGGSSRLLGLEEEIQAASGLPVLRSHDVGSMVGRGAAWAGQLGLGETLPVKITRAEIRDQPRDPAELLHQRFKRGDLSALVGALWAWSRRNGAPDDCKELADALESARAGTWREDAVESIRRIAENGCASPSVTRDITELHARLLESGKLVPRDPKRSLHLYNLIHELSQEGRQKDDPAACSAFAAWRMGYLFLLPELKIAKASERSDRAFRDACVLGFIPALKDFAAILFGRGESGRDEALAHLAAAADRDPEASLLHALAKVSCSHPDASFRHEAWQHLRGILAVSALTELSQDAEIQVQTRIFALDWLPLEQPLQQDPALKIVAQKALEFHDRIEDVDSLKRLCSLASSQRFGEYFPHVAIQSRLQRLQRLKLPEGLLAEARQLADTWPISKDAGLRLKDLLSNPEFPSADPDTLAFRGIVAAIVEDDSFAAEQHLLKLQRHASASPYAKARGLALLALLELEELAPS